MKKGFWQWFPDFPERERARLMKALLKKYENYALSISATTRQPREGEADGREYFF